MQRERRVGTTNWIARLDSPTPRGARYRKTIVGWLIRAAFFVLVSLAVVQHFTASAPGWLLLILLGLSGLLAATAALPIVCYGLIWAAFVVTRAVADDLGQPERRQRVIDIDRLLGGGALPTDRLQQVADGTIIVDIAAAVHVSYFVVPHLAAAGLWWWERRRRGWTHLRLLLSSLAVTMALSVAVFALAPVAPPWLAAERGANIGRVERLAGFLSGSTDGGSSATIVSVSDQNPVAALPSLHMAVTVVVALVLWRISLRLGAAALAYALLMGLSLVLLGEHYLIDVLTGGLLALAVVAMLWRVASTDTRRDDQRA